MATSKKAVATSGIGLGKKVIFDDEGEAHQAYKILEEEEYKQTHDMQTEINEFVTREKEKVQQADQTDKLVAKNKRAEKKRKRKLASEGALNVSTCSAILVFHLIWLAEMREGVVVLGCPRREGSGISFE